MARMCAYVQEFHKRICVSWPSQQSWTPQFRLSPDIYVIRHMKVAWDRNREFAVVEPLRVSGGFKLDLRGIVPPGVTITRVNIGIGSSWEGDHNNPGLKTPSVTITAPPRADRPGKPKPATAAEISASLGFPVRGVRSRR